MRRIYAERRQVLFEATSGAPKGWFEPFPSAAGLHLALRLPPEVDAVEVLKVAAGLGVGAYPLSQFAVQPSAQNGLVLGYGALPKDDVRIAALALVEAARQVG